MKKLLLSLVAILVLASFTTLKSPTILTDIDGTLLKSYVSIQQFENQNTATFTVDANTVVTTVADENGTHVYLVENGVSGVTVQHTITFTDNRIGFVNYFESNGDVASTDGSMSSSSFMVEKPQGILKGDD